MTAAVRLGRKLHVRLQARPIVLVYTAAVSTATLVLVIREAVQAMR